jgi:hypothetical protein
MACTAVTWTETVNASPKSLKMNNSVKSLLLLVLLILSFWAAIFIQFQQVLNTNQGMFVYTHDDAYIHLAMAKHYAANGTWGVTPYEFSSSSSSLLWTFLLALCISLFGLSDLIPLILNIFFGSLLIVILFWWLTKEQLSLFFIMLIEISVLLFFPIRFMVFAGLEHVLHVLISIIILMTFHHVSHYNHSRCWYGLYGLAALVPLIRYEGLFLIAAIGVLLLYKKKIKKVLIITLSALLPITVYGLISVSKGWYVLPNSVLLKGNRPDVSSLSGIWVLLYEGYRQLVYNFHLHAAILAVLIIWLYLYRNHPPKTGQPAELVWLIGITMAFHLSLASSGYFITMLFGIRYDGYLLILILILIGFLLGSLPLENWTWKNKLTAGCIYLLMFLPALERGLFADGKIATATNNVYLQQYQMARFVKQYYSAQVVAVNDIGCINFLADVKCIDLMALANKQVADLILNHHYTADRLDSLLKERKCRLIMIFDRIFQLMKLSEKIPANWIKVGQWTIPNNVISAYHTVSFYALNKEDAAQLNSNLADFKTNIPPQVIQQGYYLQATFFSK